MIAKDYIKFDVPEGYLSTWQETVDLMAKVFEVPAGLVMRVGEQQLEVLVSSVTEDNPYEAHEKAELNTGLYCETVIRTQRHLHVPNALDDPKWMNNPDVTLNMISYLGIPLLWPSGDVFGTICVLDSKTRHYTEDYIKLLWQFKAIIENDFKIIAELEQAKRMQQAILPHQFPDIPGAAMAAQFIPMLQVGGDFYHVVELQDCKYAIVIADVTGHGIPAALISFMVYAILFNNVNLRKPPEQTLQAVNGLLRPMLPEDTFASMAYGLYDSQAKVLTYANAGHPPAIVIRPSTGELITLEAEGPAIGISPDPLVAFESKSIELQPGDKVLFYTDGLTELVNANDEMLEEGGLNRWLREEQQQAIDPLIHNIVQRAVEYAGRDEFDDDVALIGLEVK
jgi:hypothetical protein